MLQNRQNQVANVQIAARRNLDQVALVAGTPRLPFISKHRLYSSMYGKRPSSPTLPIGADQHDPRHHLGSGSGDVRCHRSRLRISAVSSVAILRQSERLRVLSEPVVVSAVVEQVVSPVASQTGGLRGSQARGSQQRTSPSTTTWQTTQATTTMWRIPATAWAAFAIQKAIRG
jgi:hypothetical protein